MGSLQLRLHNTLTGAAEPLQPREAGTVGVYCCGPTTYDQAHVGHARAALAPDLLTRHLRARGLKVTYVRNITDVDDKILKRAAEAGEPPMELSARFTALYQADMRAFGCLDPDVEPKVSEHIGHIVALIETLVAQGAAYAVTMPDGSTDVYYAVRAFPTYGKLSGRKLEQLRVGARVEASDVKRDPLDFALWKGVAGDGWSWDSPWGKGRPGWHIECSAMSAAYLGHGFDVHTGGMDLIFPHHENEIAQSEAAHPGEGAFVRTWLHNGFVNVDKEKMAKSLGNFVTVRDVYDRYDPEALRYFLLGVHYRGPIAFETDKRADGRVVFPGVAEGERRVDYLYGTLERLAELSAAEEGPVPAKLPGELGAKEKVFAEAAERVAEALDDDLNAPVGLAVIAELASAANELCDMFHKRKKDARFRAMAADLARKAERGLRRSSDLLGLLQSSAADYRRRTRALRLSLAGLTEAEVEAKLGERTAARAAKDFARADAVRVELEARGIELADSPTGTTWWAAVQ